MNKGELFLQMNEFDVLTEKLKMSVEAIMSDSKDSVIELAKDDAMTTCNDLIQTLIQTMYVMDRSV